MLWLFLFPGRAEVPGILSYQGRLTVSGLSFSGSARFKFALVDQAGTTTYWSHNNTSVAGGEPSDPAISVVVQNGLFSLNLGDRSVPNMTTAIPASVFAHDQVYVRVWAHDGSHGWQLLTPDRRIAAVGYALAAETVTGNVPASNLTGTIPAGVLEPSLPSGVTVTSTTADDASLLAKGYRRVMSVPAPPWSNGASAMAPSARYGHTAVWTGSQMVVWGGRTAAGTSVLRSGAMYSPGADQWTTVSTLDAPDARSEHTAVWTGTQMLVWGGHAASGMLNTGGRFNPANQHWDPTSTAGAPPARYDHVAVWTGNRMLLWGGWNTSGLLNDGALYDPVTDQWTSLTVSGPPVARRGAVGVWAGDRLLIWGGEGANGLLGNGASLVFAGGVPSAWNPLPTANAPAARRSHTAVWTGGRFIVWGGDNSSAPLGDGAAFDVVENRWTALPRVGAPAARSQHAAVWTGQEMLILHGSSGSTELGSGAAYDPTADRWRTLANGGSPLARSLASAIWTGTEALVFGGRSGGVPAATLQRLVPEAPWYFYRKP